MAGKRISEAELECVKSLIKDIEQAEADAEQYWNKYEGNHRDKYAFQYGFYTSYVKSKVNLIKQVLK